MTAAVSRSTGTPAPLLLVAFSETPVVRHCVQGPFAVVLPAFVGRLAHRRHFPAVTELQASCRETF